MDGAGKTTAIKQLLENNNDFIYSKGLGSDTFIGKLARKFPSTLMFMLDLIYTNYKIVKPNLRKNKIILQDRYDASIISYTPKSENLYNKIIAKILKKFIIKPDALVYFHVSLEERIKRLKNDKNKNKYHALLSKNPDLIILREKEYLRLYNQFKENKIKIDTTNLNAKQSSEILRDFISGLFKNIY